MKENQLNDYCLFLDNVNTKLEKFFKKQEPYIFCKEGCSYCCEDGEYPCSELEFSMLKLGFQRMEEDLQQIVIEKTKKLKELKKQNPDKVLSCECPFLINKRCSAYIYRPIICRTFGLPFFDAQNKLKIPFCHELGLNYSNVYDKERNILSDELYKKTGFEQEPVAFNLSLSFLLNKVGKAMELDFGEERTITDWMIDLIE